jgi:hypothetical protein
MTLWAERGLNGKPTPAHIELDGGERGKVRKLDIEVEPGAVEVCVPA